MRRRRTERGATLVETSLVMPFLILLGLGLTEIGFLVVDYLTVANAAREGARTGAAAADYDDVDAGVDADDLILYAVEQAACNLQFGDLVSVSIFKSDADGAPIDPVNALNEYAPGGALDCAGSTTSLTCANDCPWAPAERDRQLPDLDSVGVEVVFSHQGVTNLLPFPTVTWRETAVMRLELKTQA